jgi:hypothetical protein
VAVTIKVTLAKALRDAMNSAADYDTAAVREHLALAFQALDDYEEVRTVIMVRLK